MLTQGTQDKQVWLAQYTRHAQRDYLIQANTRQIQSHDNPFSLASHVYQLHDTGS